MMSVLQPPIKLRDLIRQIRASRTSAKEREIITKECALIRTAFRQEAGASEYRSRNVAKLLYIHMLGFPAHFGQLECLKLVASASFSDKRIGYLGAMMLLDERTDVHLLVTNSMKNDINNSNQYIVGLALCTLGAICSPEMARDLQDDIEKILKSTSCNPYLRKKAALCAVRMISRAPELIENFISVTRSLLGEKDHSVINGGILLISEMCKHDKETLHHFRQLVATLCGLLKTLVMAGFNPEHDVQGLTDPFLQVNILQLLRLLGHGCVEASDAMNDVLAQVATNIDGSKNVGNSILYETVKTIMHIEAESGLRVLAINILGKFLQNSDKNIRYVALNTLLKTIEVDNNAVQRHRNTVVDCLSDPDISIRRRALELTFALVNENNIRTLLRELLSFLEVADAEFKSYMAYNICASAEKYAPNRRWHIDTIMKVLVNCGNYISDDVISSMIALITQNTELHAYIVQSLFRALQEDISQQPLVQIASWSIGEYGDLLVSGVCEEGEPLRVSEQEVVELLEIVLKSPHTSGLSKAYILSALMKLTTRCSHSSALIQKIIQPYRTSISTELQQRACEYNTLFDMDRMRSALLERMPPMEKKRFHYTNQEGEEEPEYTAAASPSQSSLHPPAGAAHTMDLLDLLSGSPPKQSHAITADHSDAVHGGHRPKAASDLLDLLGDDLLGDSLPKGNPSSLHSANYFNPSASGASGGASGGGDAMLDLLASSPPKSSAGSNCRMDVWDKDEVNIYFMLEKLADAGNVTAITLTATNQGPVDIQNFNFQAAVPKALKLQILPPSGQHLPAFGSLSIRQQIKVSNPTNIPLKMRVRIQYSLVSGQQIVEQKEVSDFPLL